MSNVVDESITISKLSLSTYIPNHVVFLIALYNRIRPAVLITPVEFN